MVPGPHGSLLSLEASRKFTTSPPPSSGAEHRELLSDPLFIYFSRAAKEPFLDGHGHGLSGPLESPTNFPSRQRFGNVTEFSGTTDSLMY